MAASAWRVTDEAKQRILTNATDFDTDTFAVKLSDNLSTLALSADETYTEHSATSTGYTAGGIAVTVTVSNASTANTKKITTATVIEWTAGTNGIDAKYAVLENTTAGKLGIICYCELNTGGTLAVTSGNKLTITLATDGFLTLGGATA